MKYNIKSMVENNKQVRFKYFRGTCLYYETECGFIFAVPISDIGEATFLSQDKAMFFMRYIRKAITELEKENIKTEG